MKPRLAPFTGLCCPGQLVGLPPEVLEDFATDAKELIRDAVSQNGGSLERNLAHVELTLALYSVFSSPPDVVVWDGGDQTYTHKLLTGRAGRLSSSRLPGGLAGFPRRDESPHDVFGTGHRGTALSAALGMALARDLKQSEEAVVAVIDVASLACGLTLEAMTMLATSGTSLTVVLVDDGGANSPLSEPGVFESLGIASIGPVDGHDISAMQTAFATARARSGAAVVHAKLASAIQTRGRPPTLLNDLMARDPKAVVVTTDSAAFTHPRVISVGDREQHAVTLAAGMAARGFKPYCCIPSTQLQRAYDQILHDVCLQHLAVRFLVSDAQLSEHGPTHHGVFDMAFLSEMPGMVVAAPSSLDQLEQLILWSQGYSKGPCAIRYPVDLSDDEKRSRLEPFRAHEVIRGTGEVAYLAVGGCLDACLTAAHHLLGLGIEAGVVDLVWAKPLDEPLIAKLAARTKTLVVVEEGIPIGGVGQRVQAVVQAHGQKCEVRLHNTGDTLRKWGPVDYLRKQCGLGVASLIESGL